MKIVLTESLGNISKPLTAELVQKDYMVTLISHNPENNQPLKLADFARELAAAF